MTPKEVKKLKTLLEITFSSFLTETTEEFKRKTGFSITSINVDMINSWEIGEKYGENIVGSVEVKIEM